MHVLFLCGWYPTRVFNSNGDFIQRHAKAVAMLHKVSVLHIVTDPNLKSSELEIVCKANKGVKEFIAYVKQTKNPLKKLWVFQKAFKEIIKKVDKVDVVHLNEIFPFGFFALHLKRRKIPYVISEHWTGYHNKNNISLLNKLLGRRVVKKASFVCPVSKDLQNSLVEVGFKGSYSVVPNVVDTNLFVPISEEKESEKIRLLHVSNFNDEHKNVSGMLSVAKRLVDNNIDFHWDFVGGDDRQYQASMRELNIPKSKISFHAHVPQSEIVDFMNRSDIFVLFSNKENLPCVVLEAFSTGLYVVSTDVGGVTEFFPSDFGTIIPIRNEDALYSAIVSKAYLSSASKINMHHYAKHHFSPNQIAEQFSKLYQIALNNERS